MWPRRRSTWRPRTRPRKKTRPKTSLRRSLAVALVATIVLACNAVPRIGPLGDVPGGTRLARTAAELLTRFAAYDYALVGQLNGDKTYIVDPERYAKVAREAVEALRVFRSEVITVSADATGPVRDRLLPLADGLTELAGDATAYADGGDPGSFARVVDGVTLGWQQLNRLVGVLPRDVALAQQIERGTSFVVSARQTTRFALLVGPFGSQAEAQSAARLIGTVERVATSSPFTVRVGTYSERTAATAAASAVASRGLTTSSITEEPFYTFTRSGTTPGDELWREPVRVFDTWGLARRLSVSPDGGWIATGSDDGTVAIFSAQGVLRALPKFNAGVSQMLFSDDSAWLLAGGTTVSNLQVPSGAAAGTPVRLPAPVQAMAFVPTARAYAVMSQGPTGQPAGGAGVIGGRAPDGVVLGEPFPITTPASGGAIAPTDNGLLYIATTSSGGTDVESLRVGAERFLRGVVRIPGSVRALAVDRTGSQAAVLTDQGVFRFVPNSPNPGATIAKVAENAREIGFGLDGTFYLLTADRLRSFDRGGVERWAVPLVDGRRLVIARRVVVLDGTDRVYAVASDGAPEELGAGGTVQDLAASPDGHWVAALVNNRRAVLFSLP